MKTGLLGQYRGLRREIYVLCFGRVVTNLGSMVWPMLTMILSRKLSLDASTIAVFMVAASVIMLPANLIGGRLADRCSKKNVIIVCDIVSVAAYVVCSAISLSYVSVGLMLVAGIAQRMEYPSFSALIAELSTTERREHAYSLEYLCGNLGLVLSPTIAGILFQNLLWLSFLISGVAIGCSTVLIFLLVRDITPVTDTSVSAVYQRDRGGESLSTVLRENKTVLLFLAAMALYYGAYGQYSYLMPLDMGAVHGDSGSVIFGTVSSLNCIVVVLFTPLFTRLSRRLSEPVRILIGEVLLGAGFTMFLTLLGVIPAYYAAMLTFTWGEIITTTAEGPYLSKRIPASHRGRINGFSAVVATVVSGAIDLTVGRLYDGYGSTPAWITVIGALAAAAVLTVVLIAGDKHAYPKLYEVES